MRHSLARWLHLGLFVSVMCGVLITGWVIVLTIDNALFFHRTGLSPPVGFKHFPHGRKGGCEYNPQTLL